MEGRPLSPTQKPQRTPPPRHRLVALYSQARVRENVPFTLNLTLATDARGQLVGQVIWGDKTDEQAKVEPTVEEARVLLDLLDGYMK